MKHRVVLFFVWQTADGEKKLLLLIQTRLFNILKHITRLALIRLLAKHK